MFFSHKNSVAAELLYGDEIKAFSIQIEMSADQTGFFISDCIISVEAPKDCIARHDDAIPFSEIDSAFEQLRLEIEAIYANKFLMDLMKYRVHKAFQEDQKKIPENRDFPFYLNKQDTKLFALTAKIGNSEITLPLHIKDAEFSEMGLKPLTEAYILLRANQTPGQSFEFLAASEEVMDFTNHRIESIIQARSFLSRAPDIYLAQEKNNQACFQELQDLEQKFASLANGLPDPIQQIRTNLEEIASKAIDFQAADLSRAQKGAGCSIRRYTLLEQISRLKSEHLSSLDVDSQKRLNALQAYLDKGLNFAVQKAN